MGEVRPYICTHDARSAIDWYATLDRGPEDSGHGRTAVFRDPFGHRWMLGTETS